MSQATSIAVDFSKFLAQSGVVFEAVEDPRASYTAPPKRTCRQKFADGKDKQVEQLKTFEELERLQAVEQTAEIASRIAALSKKQNKAGNWFFKKDGIFYSHPKYVNTNLIPQPAKFNDSAAMLAFWEQVNDAVQGGGFDAQLEAIDKKYEEALVSARAKRNAKPATNPQ